MTEASPAHPAGAALRVRRADRLEGELRLPGDKSIGHRGLLFSALAAGEATVTTFRPGADVRSSAAALGLLGAVTATERDADGTVRYRVRGGGSTDAARLPGAGGETLDCGNSGTTIRLFSGALAGRPAPVTLMGDASLSRRPMERVAAPLRAMGAGVETTEGHAPLRIAGARPLRALRHELPVASAQVLGSIALAALAAPGETTIVSPGPTRDHTERLLAWLGVPVRREGLVTTLEGGRGFAARDIAVPGDISSAAMWLVAGALHPGGRIRIRDVGLNPSRTAIIEVLRRMGAQIAVEPGAPTGPEPVGDLVVTGGRPLRAVSLAGAEVADLIDELPVLSIAMAAAEGTSEVRDAGELRVKESDRIRLVVDGLAAIGAQAAELPDGWRVTRGRARDAGIVTGGDHRIAMAFGLAAVAGIAGTVILDDGDCVDVSYHGFWQDLATLTGGAVAEPSERSAP